MTKKHGDPDVFLCRLDLKHRRAADSRRWWGIEATFISRPLFTIYKTHLAAVVVDGEVAPRVGVSGDLAVNGRADLLGAEDALLSLLDLLHDLGVVAQLSAPLPEHLVIKDNGNKANGKRSAQHRRNGVGTRL